MEASELKRWDAWHRATARLDFVDLEKHGTAPVKMLLRWVQACEMTHNIACAIEKELEASKESPMANQLFDIIDKDGDGYVDAKELVAYMIKEFSTTVAHRLLRVLDADNDVKVSRAEWHKGWNTGQMMEVLDQARKEKEAGGKSRMQERRRANVMEMTVAAAAAQWEQRSSSVDSISSKKPPKSSSAKKLEPIKRK